MPTNTPPDASVPGMSLADYVRRMAQHLEAEDRLGYASAIRDLLADNDRKDALLREQAAVIERKDAALTLCLSFIERLKTDGVSMLAEGVHAGLRKGTDDPDAVMIHRAIGESRSTAWGDAVAFAHDPFFSMWGGDGAIDAARAALNGDPAP